jgi:citrate lyase beta subunit
VLLVDGKLIERPVIASAQRILDAADAVDRAGEDA